MNKRQKKAFIKQLIGNVSNEIIAKVDEMPDEWDGHEIRRYISERFEAANFGLCRNVAQGGGNKRRIRNYKNEVITRNL